MNKRIGVGVVCSFVGLSLLVELLFTVLRLLISDAGLLSILGFLAGSVLSCGVCLILVGFGLVPDGLRSPRGLSGVAFGCLCVALALMMSLVTDGLGTPGAIVSGVFFGASIGISFIVLLNALWPTASAVFNVGFFGAAAAGVLVELFFEGSALGSWLMAAVSGVGVLAASFATPALKNIRCCNGFSAIKGYGLVFTRMALCAGLMALAWGYASAHFLVHADSIDQWYVLAVICSTLGLTVAILFAVSHLNRTRRVSGFLLLGFLPLMMTVAFVPLDYLQVHLPGVQVCAVASFGAMLVPTIVVLARDCSRILSREGLDIVAWMLASALAGAAIGSGMSFLANDPASILWAVAPICCLWLGIISCEFVLPKNAVVDAALKRAESQAGAAGLGGDANLRERCMRLSNDCGLTAREVDVLCLLVQGYSIPRVCEMLHVAEGTATTHRRHIYQKLEVHTKNELIDRVRRYGDE